MKMVPHLILAILLAVTCGAVYPQEEDSGVKPISQAELEQILAPIALYPDTVLSHILIASTYPLEVIQAERWTVRNPGLKGSDAVEAVDNKTWDPSVKALVAFPQILKRLSEDLEWTQRLGDAFLQDEQIVLASVQSLRQRAYEEGSLNDMEKVSVTRDDDSIVIEPIEREIVYLPYYDTRVVYGPWYWSHFPPVYWDYPYQNRHYVDHHSSRFYWGPRINISFGFFFSSFHWRDHHIVRISRHHYRPHRYYNHHQIINHRYAQRWIHNPSHRRGVAYRNIHINNEYSRQNFSNRPNRSVDRAYQSVVSARGTRTSAPTVRQELRDRRNNGQQQTSRVDNFNRDRPVNSVAQRAGINRAYPQSSRRPDSARITPAPSSPIVRVNPPVRTTVVRSPSSTKPVVQRSAPNPGKSSRQDARQQHNQANAPTQPSTATRDRVRRNP